MVTTITLDEPRFKVIATRASALGKTPLEYLQSLIDADSRTFGEILEPARQGFDVMRDEDVDALFDRARSRADEQMSAP